MSPMPKKGQHESDVKAGVKKVLDRFGFKWWMPAGTTYSATVVDIHALRKGTFLAIETKWHDRELTVNQRDHLRMVNAEGGIGFVVREGKPGSKYDKAGVEELEVFLTAFSRCAAAIMEKREPDKTDGAAMLNASKALTEELA